ncbi:hypothetical protein HanIR_Chr15g0746091 [Helianthus annuus]|nr:hypothetical protein HanIR_Chr15g0746091 [Helianthus annuus]
MIKITSPSRSRLFLAFIFLESCNFIHSQKLIEVACESRLYYLSHLVSRFNKWYQSHGFESRSRRECSPSWGCNDCEAGCA